MYIQITLNGLYKLYLYIFHICGAVTTKEKGSLEFEREKVGGRHREIGDRKRKESKLHNYILK